MGLSSLCWCRLNKHRYLYLAFLVIMWLSPGSRKIMNQVLWYYAMINIIVPRSASGSCRQSRSRMRWKKACINSSRGALVRLDLLVKFRGDETTFCMEERNSGTTTLWPTLLTVCLGAWSPWSPGTRGGPGFSLAAFMLSAIFWKRFFRIWILFAM